MFWRTVSLLGLGALALSIPVPDHPTQGGFQPLQGARGPSGPSGYNAPAPESIYNGPSGGGGGGSAGPSKTIYVNVPPSRPEPAPRPIAAGPPRKHYKIVFIRAPTPPPAPQPILPPRTEQKTLIYVLHQRPEAPTQEVIEVPTIKHNPEVYFVQYDNPPTAEELQQLTAGAYGPNLGSGILPQLDVDTRGFSRASETGAGSPNLIQADDAALDALGPIDTSALFSPDPASAAPAPAPAAPDAGIPLSAADTSAPIDSGVPVDEPAPVFVDTAPEITLDQAAQIFVSPNANEGISLSDVSSVSLGAPETPAVPSEPAAPSAPAPADTSFGVPLPSTGGSSGGGISLASVVGASGGGIPIPSARIGSSPGGSTIAAGVLQNEGPQTFPFELGDAFGQRTVQRRR